MTNNYNDSTSSLAELVREYVRLIDRINHEHAADVLRDLDSGELMIALGTGIFYAREVALMCRPICSLRPVENLIQKTAMRLRHTAIS
ncbi:hypothetical protein PG2093B_1367 [Bifidobacterium pseudolongum subsp. globosum]|uniref:Uncharacterized protein n=1 Tax=Bifidobacterium pseudolongum subsp. globosum TaxID=1690 RepID=A0A4Q5A1I9_9BIFI|nr:hypothetical protein [Bifidobacterium pseudolongum]RYQ09083.1 hypothetical protein PG2093B_1367 [Bifidobacterium pseudolongum subsp. globosum]